MKKIRYFLEYILLKLISKILQLLPRRTVLFLGSIVGDLAFYCIPVRKKITIENIRLAFPEKNEHEVRRVAREAYRNLGMNIFEHLCLPYLTNSELIGTLQLDDQEILKRVFSRKKGTVLVGGHLGNWEYVGGAISAMGYPLAVIVAKIKNPYINKMINGHRQKTGVKTLPKRTSVRGSLKTLQQNGFLAILIDQDARKNGILVDYFGRPCSTPRGPAVFALRTGAALVYVSSTRQPDGSLRAVFEEMDVNYEAGVTEENILAIMQQCTARLEADVRQYPGQWFWMHRRWKTSAAKVLRKSESRSY